MLFRSTVTGLTITSAPLATLTTTPGPTPTGAVQFLVNNAPVGSAVALSSGGVAQYTFNTSCSTLGQQNLTAVYSGNATYTGSKGPALSTGQVTGTGGTVFSSNGSIITAPLILTVAAGTCPSFSMAPTGSGVTINGSNGTVTVAAGGTIPTVSIKIGRASCRERV